MYAPGAQSRTTVDACVATKRIRISIAIETPAISKRRRFESGRSQQTIARYRKYVKAIDSETRKASTIPHRIQPARPTSTNRGVWRLEKGSHPVTIRLPI